ncbi:hypothetical protein C8N46_101680 [Kordia periserrulae]|uniref:Uncharacterized protein n=1 Tax=Kordia periserrulae TaxID=701523 RepID=A0A2T6C6W4_9FLAO|nr:hypothetical protein [Kordia periserrulae]PTX64070.1 hypothetical protein C8N46_101680 [Kordia periserrulae]
MKHLKITYYILAMLVVSMQWSCSKDDDRIENTVEQSIDLSKYKGISTVEIDGKEVKTVDDLESTIKNAYSVHFDYPNNKIAISTSEVDAKRYLEVNHPQMKAKIANKIEKSLQQASQSTKPFLAINSKGHDEFAGGPLAKVDHDNDHDYGIIDDHSDSGFFLFEKSDVSWIEGLADVPNTSNTTTFHYMSTWWNLRDLASSFNTRYSVAEQYGYNMHVRYTRDEATRDVWVVYFDDANYGGQYNIVSVDPNEDVIVTSSSYKVDGTNVAGSILILY